MTSKSYSIVDCIDFDEMQLPSEFATIKEKIADLKIHDEDVFVTSYPKSGTHWCQEMVYLLSTNLDYEGAKRSVDQRSTWLEGISIVKATDKFANEHNITERLKLSPIDETNYFRETEGRRFYVSHLPFYMLPKQIINGEKQAKIVHIIRNPKQVATSYYFFLTTVWPMFKGNLEDFINLYVEGKIPLGYYFNTVQSYWNERHRSNLLILTFEEMSKDLYGSIKKTAQFLGKSYSEEQLRKLEHHLSFDQMKNNEALNRKVLVGDQTVGVLRKGKTDSYKEELSPELIQKLDSWVIENTKKIGLPFKW